MTALSEYDSMESRAWECRKVAVLMRGDDDGASLSESERNKANNYEKRAIEIERHLRQRRGY